MAKRENSVLNLINQFERSTSEVDRAKAREKSNSLKFKVKKSVVAHAEGAHEMTNVLDENPYMLLFGFNQRFEQLAREQQSLLEQLQVKNQDNPEALAKYSGAAKSVHFLLEHIQERKNKMHEQLQSWPEIIEGVEARNTTLRESIEAMTDSSPAVVLKNT